MSFQTKVIIFVVIYLIGGTLALYEYSKYIDLEKEAHKLAIDYHMRSKVLGCIIAVLFSWLSLSALYRLAPKNKKEEKDELSEMRK